MRALLSASATMPAIINAAPRTAAVGMENITNTSAPDDDCPSHTDPLPTYYPSRTHTLRL